ncbi:MAG: manganese efflux pump MntP family protein [Lachnospiraceae bacterium]|jgi:putative Mn2+ efflux pump MntP|nr:manganese efflux pump MntP family protein [Lachnospiraceae bacterium]
MTILELFLIAVGLSMDAFAVSVCKGLAMPKLKARSMLIIGAWFGGFQALMPVLGWLLGAGFSGKIQKVDHWIAFILLALVGGNMIREAIGEAKRNRDGCDCASDKTADKAQTDVKTMFMLAVATSIDALAVGVTFAFLNVNIIEAALFIGIITFTISAAGVYVGHRFGERWSYRAEFAGGAVLCILALKILIQHLAEHV